MKRVLLIWSLLTIVLLQVHSAIRLDEFLERIEVTEIRVLQSESIYDSILEIMIEQPVDVVEYYIGRFRRIGKNQFGYPLYGASDSSGFVDDLCVVLQVRNCCINVVSHNKTKAKQNKRKPDQVRRWPFVL